MTILFLPLPPITGTRHYRLSFTTYKTLAMVLAGIIPNDSVLDDFDIYLISVLRENRRRLQQKSIAELSKEYVANAGTVLKHSLASETHPEAERKVKFNLSRSGLEREGGDGIVRIVFCSKGKDTGNNIVYSTGFIINVDGGLVVTCAHTFEYFRAPINKPAPLSGVFIITPCSTSPRGYAIHPVDAVPSSLPKCNVVLLKPSWTTPPPRSVPVSRNPSQQGTRLCIHTSTNVDQIISQARSEWKPWIDSHCRWVKSAVVGYGRHRGAGAIDCSADMDVVLVAFNPPPPVSSGGGAIVEETTGTVVGMVSGFLFPEAGSGIDARLIFKMFS